MTEALVPEDGSPVGRAWTTVNPSTGARETFIVFIGNEALRAWEQDRVRLARLGHPDWPPVVYSANQRIWSIGGNDFRIELLSSELASDEALASVETEPADAAHVDLICTVLPFGTLRGAA